MNIVTQHTGWIEVICGSMFSGKSEELIRRLRRAQIARQKVLAFKPALDTRYDESAISSHSELSIPCIPIAKAEDIWAHIAADTQVVGIDEVQFLGDEIVPLCQTLANRGVRIICAGLDQDYRGEPFEPVPRLLALAEFITKALAICVVCGNPANRTQRKVASAERVLIGAAEAYEPRCRLCHSVEPLAEDQQLRLDLGPGASPGKPVVP